MSSAEQQRIERRSGHRFDQYQVPVRIQAPDGRAGSGFTLNLSSRGALVWTDFPMTEGQCVEISLMMPAEISMAEDTSVRCRARVLRLQGNAERGKPTVAVRIEHYEFLPRDVLPVQHVEAELQVTR
jgi:PilZ domain